MISNNTELKEIIKTQPEGVGNQRNVRIVDDEYEEFVQNDNSILTNNKSKENIAQNTETDAIIDWMRMTDIKSADDANNLNISHFEDNEIGTFLYKGEKKIAKSLGLVIYGDMTIYSDLFSENSDIHIHGSDKNMINKVLLTLKGHFEVNYKVKVQNILLGHEHGTKNGKCHYQIVVDFEKETYILIKPGSFSIQGTKMLFMAQKAKSPHKLRSYCKKDGDFYWLYDQKKQEEQPVAEEIQTGIELDPSVRVLFKKNGNVDAFTTVIKNREKITKAEAMELILHNDSRTGMTMYKNIEYCIDKVMADKIPEFEWVTPTHFFESDTNASRLVQNWFYKWCVPEDLERRKSLLLYSKKRALGKSTFARNLVNHPNYLVEFRNTFTNAAITGKSPKLLHLEDMIHYTEANKETWKSLVASEKTAIRDCYVNTQFDFKVPCIITTNNLLLLKNLMISEEFNTQIVFVEIDTYIGPVGTEKVEFLEREMSISLETMNFISKGELKRKEFLNKKVKNSNNLDTDSVENFNNFDPQATEYEKLQKEKNKLQRELDNFKNFHKLHGDSSGYVTLANLYEDKKKKTDFE